MAGTVEHNHLCTNANTQHTNEVMRFVGWHACRGCALRVGNVAAVHGARLSPSRSTRAAETRLSIRSARAPGNAMRSPARRRASEPLYSPRNGVPRTDAWQVPH